MFTVGKACRKEDTWSYIRIHYILLELVVVINQPMYMCHHGQLVYTVLTCTYHYATCVVCMYMYYIYVCIYIYTSNVNEQRVLH